MYVYLITNAVNGKIYVGQHKGDDLQHYLQQKFYEAEHRLKARSHLYAAIRKYGRDAFSIRALLSDIQTRVELDQHERDFIASLKSQDPDIGYNICRGGEGFTGPHSTEAKAKLAAAHRGREKSPETCARISAAKLGHAVSKETRRKLSEANRGHHPTEEARRKQIVAQIGKKHKPFSDETKRKMSKAAKGRVPWNKGKSIKSCARTEEWRQKTSESIKKWWASRRNTNATAKARRET